MQKRDGQGTLSLIYSCMAQLQVVLQQGSCYIEAMLCKETKSFLPCGEH